MPLPGQSSDDTCREVDRLLDAVLLGGSASSPHRAAVIDVRENEGLNQQLLSSVWQLVSQLGQP